MTTPARLGTQKFDNNHLIQTLNKENKQLRKELKTLKENVTIAAVATLTVSTAATAFYLYNNPTALTDLSSAISTNFSNGYTWVASFFNKQP